jgi:dihydroneopterin aldolase/2-amino-4-hydroxy-6-hydroxymethyldihydropteridine diphosphokinase/dihydropteroate synthase
MLLDGTDSSSDVVYLKNVQLRAVVGPEAWHRPGRQQPVLVSVKMPTSINEAGDLDDVTNGILSKSITKLFSGKPEFASLRELAERVAHAALIEGNGKDSMHITALLPEALLLADGLGISARFRAAKNKDGSSNLHTEQQTLFVKDLRLNCILGVNPHERIEKQPVIINIEFNRFENTLLTEYATSIKLAAEVSSDPPLPYCCILCRPL